MSGEGASGHNSVVNSRPASSDESESDNYKRALPPTVAESLRAVFAAFLWHEGIVHDAMACASFLKFHPMLPKYTGTFAKEDVEEVVAKPLTKYLFNL